MREPRSRYGRVALPTRDADKVGGKSGAYASRLGVPHPVEFAEAVAEHDEKKKGWGRGGCTLSSSAVLFRGRGSHAGANFFFEFFECVEFA